MMGLQVLLAACSSWFLLAALIPLLQRRLLDLPNARSSHTMPTPRGGGVVFVLVASLAWVLLGHWSLLWCLPLALVGLLDDWRGLPVGVRYGAQLLTAWVLLAHSTLPGVEPWSWLAVLVVIAATAVINFTNFMDGLDGLVAGCMAVVLAAAALGGSPQLWPLVGALLGFLGWNWPPARVFMGDAGSTFLGVVLVAALLGCRSWNQAFGLLLVATPLLADAASCVLRRGFVGQSLFQAHRLHLYQRLHRAGWSHRRVSAVYVGATTVLAVLQQFGGWPAALFGTLVVVAVGFRLENGVAVPFAQAASRAIQSPSKPQKSASPPC